MGILSEVISVAKRLVEAGYPESTAMKIATGELPMDQISRMARAKEQGFTEKAYHSGKDASGKIYDGSYEPTGRGIINVDPEDGSNMFASGGSPFVSQSYTGSMRQSPTSYPLLVNTKNFEKTNAEGQMWNDIDSPYVYAPNGELVRSDFTVSLGNGVKGKEPLYEKEVLDTNRLARGAKERGASGVVIDNVRDIGANSLRMYDAIKRSGLDQDEWNKLYGDQGGQVLAINDGTKARSLLSAAFDPAKTGSSNLLASNPVATTGAGILGLGAAAQSSDTYADFSPSNLARLRSDDVGSIEAPQSMAAANIAGLMGNVNKVGYDDPLLGMVASQLPSELMNKIAYNDKRGLLDYAKAYAGLLGF